jgi:hypothetical protein
MIQRIQDKLYELKYTYCEYFYVLDGSCRYNLLGRLWIVACGVPIYVLDEALFLLNYEDKSNEQSSTD